MMGILLDVGRSRVAIVATTSVVSIISKHVQGPRFCKVLVMFYKVRKLGGAISGIISEITLEITSPRASRSVHFEFNIVQCGKVVSEVMSKATSKLHHQASAVRCWPCPGVPCDNVTQRGF